VRGGVGATRARAESGCVGGARAPLGCRGAPVLLATRRRPENESLSLWQTAPPCPPLFGWVRVVSSWVGEECVDTAMRGEPLPACVLDLRENL